MLQHYAACQGYSRDLIVHLPRSCSGAAREVRALSNSITPLPMRHEAAAPDAGAVALRSEHGRLGGDRRWAARRSWIRQRTLMFVLLLAELLNACGGGDGSGQSAVAMPGDSAVPTVPPVPPAVPTQAWTGHYVGAVKTADGTYFGDAVFSRDGTVRLYVGGRYDDGGELQMARPEGSVQFVGTVQVRDGQWSGSGVLIGQECAINAANRFCAQTGSAEISGTLQFDAGGSGTEQMQGEIQVATDSGKEIWRLDLLLWSDDPIAPSEGTGQFKEMVAEFAYPGAVIVSFDSTGKFYFQSANSGCAGNGMLVPTVGGSAGPYTATLLMQSCNGAYTYLNGTYEGVALGTPSSRWDYDSLLRIWLSKPTGETPQAALTMLDESL